MKQTLTAALSCIFALTITSTIKTATCLENPANEMNPADGPEKKINFYLYLKTTKEKFEKENDKFINELLKILQPEPPTNETPSTPKQPAVTTKKPDETPSTPSTPKEPEVTTKKPDETPSTSKEPAVTTKTPDEIPSTSKEPAVTTEKPDEIPSTSKEPEVTTKKPDETPSTPKEPAVTTEKPDEIPSTPKEPAVTTKKPDATPSPPTDTDSPKPAAAAESDFRSEVKVLNKSGKGDADEITKDDIWITSYMQIRDYLRVSMRVKTTKSKEDVVKLIEENKDKMTVFEIISVDKPLEKEEDNGKKGLVGWEIALIVIAVLVAVTVIASIFIFWRKGKARVGNSDILLIHRN